MSEETKIITLGDIFKNIETEEKAFKFKDYIKDLQQKVKEKNKEIDRLNVVINKYRIGIEDMWVDNAGEDTWIYNGKDFLSREEFLDKLKKLKENK